MVPPNDRAVKWRVGPKPVYAARRDRRVRRVVSFVVVALIAAGCGDLVADPSAAGVPSDLLIRQSPSPFQQVSAGPITAVIPDAWRPQLAGATDDPRQGLVAGPRPRAWQTDRTPIEGLAAMWVDGTQIGVPSDYYYLAATNTALDLITGSERCSSRHHVIVDHVPAFARGAPDSPGDFVARGNGTCLVRDQLTRWAYFVAAPGYGPVREVGIPSSSLYVVVAVMPESPRAPFLLARLLERTRFNGASVSEMIAVAQPPTSFQIVGPV
jgi:hypothetical protein